MENKVKELAAKLVEVIDKKDGWENAEQKLGYIKAYLLGLQDGFDYCVEEVSSMSCVSITGMRELYTCVKCGDKTPDPLFVKVPFGKDGKGWIKQPYCKKCEEAIKTKEVQGAGNKG